ncbi:hypothetical protein [Lignipirellula cremea]|uniref:Uncharacterized protein n=1 Tax=Lignipirellula cremea TaxID=2528010 RepID=A0A518E2W3_9BACT|nr:hypothetical protein [Lignipirellula cremea]QDU98424.1 hypothetical protein Pla8534_62920 [Lignipirellula cremea]
MKRTLLSLAAILFCAAPAAAQQPTLAQRAEAEVLEQQTPTLTPELWLYLQELRRQEDPMQAVRRNAEARADQRRHRIASSKWFGVSNSRPLASPTPFMGTYSPRWHGNGPNGTWVGQGQPWTAILVPYADRR